MKLLQDAGILIPQGGVAKTPEQAYEIASTLGTYYLTDFKYHCVVSDISGLYSLHVHVHETYRYAYIVQMHLFYVITSITCKILVVTFHNCYRNK